MKRSFIVVGGEKPHEPETKKVLPQLSDAEINKLYKVYSELDDKQQKFKGTKREYCGTVAGMIGNFVDKVITKKPKISGGAKGKTAKGVLTEVKDLRRLITKYTADKEHSEKILEKALEHPGSVTDQEISDARKGLIFSNNMLAIRKRELEEELENPEIVARIKQKRTAIATEISKLFPERSRIFEKEKRYITTGVPEHSGISGVYKESAPKKGVKNPFYFPPKAGYPEIKTNLKTPAGKFKTLIDYAFTYRTFFKKLLKEDVTAAKNFLILAPFTEILEETPEGVTQRLRFTELLTSKGRNTIAGTFATEWGPNSEACYRSEKFIYWNILNRSRVQPLSSEEIAERNFELLGKILSLNLANQRVDYNFLYYTGESKGKKTLNGMEFVEAADFKGSTVRPQVNLSKILQVLYSSASHHDIPDKTTKRLKIGKPEILFCVYRSDSRLNEYNSNDATSVLPYEVIFSLNIANILKDRKNTELAKSLIPYINEYIKSDPVKFPSATAALAYEKEPLKILQKMIHNYMGEDFSTGDIFTSLSTKDPVLSVNIAHKELADKFGVAGYSKDLFEGVARPSAHEYSKFFTDREKHDKYEDFWGSPPENYNFPARGSIGRNLAEVKIVTDPDGPDDATKIQAPDYSISKKTSGRLPRLEFPALYNPSGKIDRTKLSDVAFVKTFLAENEFKPLFKIPSETGRGEKLKASRIEFYPYEVIRYVKGKMEDALRDPKKKDKLVRPSPENIEEMKELIISKLGDIKKDRSVRGIAYNTEIGDDVFLTIEEIHHEKEQALTDDLKMKKSLAAYYNKLDAASKVKESAAKLKALETLADYTSPAVELTKTKYPDITDYAILRDKVFKMQERLDDKITATTKKFDKAEEKLKEELAKADADSASDDDTASVASDVSDDPRAAALGRASGPTSAVQLLDPASGFFMPPINKIREHLTFVKPELVLPDDDADVEELYQDLVQDDEIDPVGDPAKTGKGKPSYTPKPKAYKKKIIKYY